MKFVISALFLAGVFIKPLQAVSQDEAYSILAPALRAESDSENPSGLKGKIMTGYQGWFRAEGDGAGMGFHHYGKGKKFGPNHLTIDLWPDMSEYEEEEKFETVFRHRDGRPAEVFSSVNLKTVNRHFKWMKDYGIDGAFVQRFGVVGAKNYRSYHFLKADNQKLLNCREAANANGRAYALMYDLSGLRSEDFERLNRDWKILRTRMKLGTDPNDKAYLQYKGKPLVAIWGVGFQDDRGYSLEDSEKFIRLLKHNPEWGGMSVMLGVPFGFRELKRDATTDENLHKVLKLADIVSPWSVGRYRQVDFESGKHVSNLVEDQKWCERNQLEYLPVIYPGFSWHNMKGEKLDAVPRRGGSFYWDQFVGVRAAGIDTAYLAMFDEVDEATAIFKVSNDPPVGEGFEFLSNEGLPPDHYLKLSRQGGRLLRGELPVK
ncbi:MAG: glycoside hydrolase family 71/99-like protein [Akkermansiaceae bacterium]